MNIPSSKEHGGKLALLHGGNVDRPDCAKCGLPYHELPMYDGNNGASLCQGYEPMQSEGEHALELSFCSIVDCPKRFEPHGHSIDEGDDNAERHGEPDRSAGVVHNDSSLHGDSGERAAQRPVAELDPMTRRECPKCETTWMGQFFCLHDGTALRALLCCSRCAERVTASQKFCGYCGAAQ